MGLRSLFARKPENGLSREYTPRPNSFTEQIEQKGIQIGQTVYVRHTTFFDHRFIFDGWHEHTAATGETVYLPMLLNAPDPKGYTPQTRFTLLGGIKEPTLTDTLPEGVYPSTEGNIEDLVALGAAQSGESILVLRQFEPVTEDGSHIDELVLEPIILEGFSGIHAI